MFQTNKTPQPIRLTLRKRLGGGTYGNVYHADAMTQMDHSHGYLIPVDPNHGVESFAVKQNFVSPKFRHSIASIRELDMLNVVRDHPYCIQLKDITFEIPFINKTAMPLSSDKWISDKVFFILEKGDMDGNKYIRPDPPINGIPQTRLVNERKLFAVHVMLGLEFIHSRGIYHRDLKPQNVICFMNSNGELNSAKICDFGLTQYYCTQSMSQPGFVTLWYRAPEITLHCSYDYKVDVWSMGCILFELFSNGYRRFIEPANNEASINSLMTQLPFPKGLYELALAVYPSKINKDYNRLQAARKSIEQQLAYTGSKVTQFDSCGLGKFTQLVNLIENTLVVDPHHRFTISQCLNHPFFDGFRALISRTRSLYGINKDGQWILKPDPLLVCANTEVRQKGMYWFSLIYINRHKPPICNWYSHTIYFHALEMFDRYIYLVNPGTETKDRDIVVWINVFMFMSAKYFREMVEDYGLEFFDVGTIKEEYPTFRLLALAFEEQVVRDVFKFEIYRPTLLEASPEFLTEASIAYFIKLLIRNEIPSDTSLNTIHKLHSEEIQNLNRQVRNTPQVSTA